MRRARWMLVFLVFVASCSADVITTNPVGVTSSTTLRELGPDGPARVDPPSVLGSATVGMVNTASMLAGRCSGTLITPTRVLTAAHCVEGFAPSGSHSVRADPAPGEADAQTRLATRCWIHPEANSSCAPTCTCGTVGRGTFLLDVAVLELEEPFEGVTPRSIAPPASCLAEGNVPVLYRGYGPTERPRRRMPGIARATGALWRVRTDAPDGFVEGGDSGGTLEERDRLGAPVLGPISASVGFTTEAAGILLWGLPPVVPDQPRLRPVDWLWSVLDPGGSCALGASPGGCILPGATTPLADADSDGLPDVRDLCPGIPLAAGDACDGQHCDADEDWVGDECDTCPGSCDYDDPDHDGICSALDACPRVPRARSMTDTDGDHFPDACDSCPSTPPAASTSCSAPCDAIVESSGATDGRIDSECPAHCDSDGDRVGAECDACPALADDQRNCNRDAEDTLLASPPAEVCSPACGPFERCMGGRCVLVRRGDACDPTPCGETWLERSDSMASGSAELGITNVRVDGLSTLRLPLGAGTRARTGMRFCRCSTGREDSEGTREACVLDRGDGTGLCTISDLTAYRAVVEHPQWRWTSMTFAVPPRDRLAGEAGRTEALASYDLPTDAPETDLQATWQLNDDLARMGIPSASFVPGVLWTHTPGTRSTLFPDVTPDTTGATRLLTSHYWSGGVERSRAVRTVGPFECFADIAPALIPERVCLTCAAGFPGSWLLAPVEGTRCLAPPPRLPVLRVPVGALQSDDVFSALVGGLLTDGSVWVPAAEPTPWLPRVGFVYVSITSDGATAGARIISTETGLALPGFNPPPDHGPFLAAAAIGAPSPPSRSAHGLVMSARRETLWVIGGVDEDDVPLDDLWAYDLSSETWQRVEVSSTVTPERVLAATYDAVSDALYVIDEVRGAGLHPRPRARLLVLDALGRWARVAAEWPRLLPHARFALAADASGALWLAASAAAHGGHVVVRFRADDDGPDLIGFDVGSGVLASRWARADGRGLSLLVRRTPPHDDAAAVVGHATEDLSRGERRAFERVF